jgi:hypothetical protein
MLPHIPDNEALLLAVGIFGATVMPHAISATCPEYCGIYGLLLGVSGATLTLNAVGVTNG